MTPENQPLPKSTEEFNHTPRVQSFRTKPDLRVFFILIMFVLTVCYGIYFICTQHYSYHIKTTDLCGKEFRDHLTDSLSGVTNFYYTKFNCDGTFESSRSSTYSQYNIKTGTDINFTGSWEIVNNIPDNVKQAVVEFGKDDDNYTVIKYSSSNGISGYCLYYDEHVDALYLGQISKYQWSHEAGALGIFDSRL